MAKHNDTPEWLFEKWINTSEICYMMYGSKERNVTGQFTQKKHGTRPWKEEELQKLEEIRKNLESKIKIC